MDKELAGEARRSTSMVVTTSNTTCNTMSGSPDIDADFEVLSDRDAIEAINTHLSQYITDHPATIKISPDALRAVITETLERVERGGEQRTSIGSAGSTTTPSARTRIARTLMSSAPHLLPSVMGNLIALYRGGSWITRLLMSGLVAATLSSSSTA